MANQARTGQTNNPRNQAPRPQPRLGRNSNVGLNVSRNRRTAQARTSGRVTASQTATGRSGK